jgi:hypothetical protein
MFIIVIVILTYYCYELSDLNLLLPIVFPSRSIREKLVRKIIRNIHHSPGNNIK